MKKAKLHPLLGNTPGISGLDMNGRCFQARLADGLLEPSVYILASADGRLLTLDQARDLRDWLNTILVGK